MFFIIPKAFISFTLILTLIPYLCVFFSNNAYAGLYKNSTGTIFLGHHLGSTLDLDLSKTYLNAYIDFSKHTPLMRELSDEFNFKGELLFYTKQIKQTFAPKYFLVELDYYPLTALASYLYEEKPKTYDKFSFNSLLGNSKVNPIQLIGSRYEQPYAFSFFLGDIIPFKSAQGQSGSAIMGHVFTMGGKRNIKIKSQNDKWFQYSYKIKGTNNTELTEKKWKFELGYLYHENDLFFNALIFEVMRDFTTKNSNEIMANLKIEYSFNIPTSIIKEASGVKRFTTFQKIIIGRNFPFSTFTLKIDAGLKWELYKQSNGSPFSETALIVGPNISW